MEKEGLVGCFLKHQSKNKKMKMIEMRETQPRSPKNERKEKTSPPTFRLQFTCSLCAAQERF